MGNIEIKTSQNVSIEFETATVLERTIAFLIDLFLLISCSTLFTILYFASLPSGDSYVAQVFIIIVISMLYLFSIIAQEILFGGRSVGKRALGIKIIKADGREATPNDFFIRWGFKLIDVSLSLGFFAMFVISSSKRGQRLGDVVANTTVIRLKSSNKVSLDEILKMHVESSSQTITYPEAVKINDEYALVIKHVIDRYSKYKNDASSMLVKELTEKIKTELRLEIKDRNYIQFLKTFLSDYVRLTR